ncbi:MAG: hypothetical protein ACREQV_16570, partial [Candidatus Binatia bacterium]
CLFYVLDVTGKKVTAGRRRRFLACGPHFAFKKAPLSVSAAPLFCILISLDQYATRGPTPLTAGNR